MAWNPGVIPFLCMLLIRPLALASQAPASPSRPAAVGAAKAAAAVDPTPGLAEPRRDGKSLSGGRV